MGKKSTLIGLNGSCRSDKGMQRLFAGTVKNGEDNLAL